MSNFLNFAGHNGISFKSFTASGGTTYTLDKTAVSTSVLVSIGGVLQKPGTDYTVSLTTLTTTDTIASGIIIDTYVIHSAGSTTAVSSGGGAYLGEGAGGTTVGSSGDIIRINEATLNTSQTMAATDNGSATGPISIASGVTLTISSGATFVVI